MTYFLYHDDISSEVKFGDVIAIDTETMGLNINRDRLCLIQLSSGDGNAHLVQISKKSFEKQNDFSNLKKIFKNPNTTKLFHFARFDIAVIEKNICRLNGPIYCTKIASKLSRTFGAKHGLADLCKDLLNLVPLFLYQLLQFYLNQLQMEYHHDIRNNSFIIHKTLKKKCHY